jgi:hypothetical protein
VPVVVAASSEPCATPGRPASAGPRRAVQSSGRVVQPFGERGLYRRGCTRLACPQGRQDRGRGVPRVKPGPHDGFRVALGNDHAQTGLMRGCGPGTPRPHPGRRAWLRCGASPAVSACVHCGHPWRGPATTAQSWALLRSAVAWRQRGQCCPTGRTRLSPRWSNLGSRCGALRRPAPRRSAEQRKPPLVSAGDSFGELSPCLHGMAHGEPDGQGTVRQPGPPVPQDAA